MAGPPGTLVGRLRVKVLPDTSTFGPDLRAALADDANNSLTVDVDPVVNQVALRRAELQLERLARTRFAQIAPVALPGGGDGLDGSSRTLALLEGIRDNTEQIDARLRRTEESVDRLNKSLSTTRSTVRNINRETSKKGSLFAGENDTPGGSFRALDPTRILILLASLTSPAIVGTVAVLGGQIAGLAAGLTAAGGGAGVLALGFGGLIGRFVALQEASEPLPGYMQDFADSLDDVTDSYNEFLDAIAVGGFETMAQGLGIIAELLPRLVPIFEAFNEVVQENLTELAGFLGGAEGQRMLTFFEEIGAVSFDLLLEILGNLLRMFGRLFEGLGPYAIEILEDLDEATERWAASMDGIGDSPKFQKFLTFIRETGPLVYEALIAMRDAFTELGIALAPLAAPTLEAITSFFRSIADTDPGILAAVVVGATAALAALLAISAVLAVISLANPIVIVSAALIGLATALATFVSRSPEAQEDMQSLIDTIMGFPGVSEAIDTVRVALEELTTTITKAWEDFQPTLEEIRVQLGELFSSLGPEITAGIGQIAANMSAGLALLGTIVTVGLGLITGLWKLFGDELLGIVGATLGGLITNITNGMAIIEGVVRTATSILKGDWSGAWSNIQQTASAAMTFVRGLISTTLAAVVAVWRTNLAIITGILGSTWSNVSARTSEMIESLKSTIRAGLDEAVAFFTGLKGRVLGAMAGAGTWLIDTGTAILDGLISGIEAGIDTVRTLLQGLTASIPTWKGPMSVDKKLLSANADAIMDSFTNRIEGRLGQVRDVLGGLGLSTGIGLDAGTIARQNAPQVNLTVSAANERNFVENVAQATQRGTTRATNLQWRRV